MLKYYCVNCIDNLESVIEYVQYHIYRFITFLYNIGL